jgi:hypothetical protein
MLCRNSTQDEIGVCGVGGFSSDVRFAGIADFSTRIACGEYGFGDISRHDAAGSKHGSRADPYARENDCAAARTVH